MNFHWRDTPTHYRCTTDRPVKIKVFDFGGIGVHNAHVTDMGYVIARDGRFMANIYGSINPDAPGKLFDHIDEAKRYVEQQALLGLTLNKLTR
jgi:hypothetical protein